MAPQYRYDSSKREILQSSFLRPVKRCMHPTEQMAAFTLLARRKFLLNPQEMKSCLFHVCFKHNGTFGKRELVAMQISCQVRLKLFIFVQTCPPTCNLEHITVLSLTEPFLEEDRILQKVTCQHRIGSCSILGLCKLDASSL